MTTVGSKPVSKMEIENKSVVRSYRWKPSFGSFTDGRKGLVYRIVIGLIFFYVVFGNGHE